MNAGCTQLDHEYRLLAGTPSYLNIRHVLANFNGYHSRLALSVTVVVHARESRIRTGSTNVSYRRILVANGKE